MSLSYKDWNIEAITGYKPKTTFYMDFGIAEHFGASAIRDTCRRAFEQWRSNVEYLTELVMVLNWKIWEHYETKPALAQLYTELWEKVNYWAMHNLTGDDLSYFFSTTD